MHIQTICIRNFRRLKDVRIDLEKDSTVFVGANNSGKTSVAHLFQRFLGPNVGDFSIYDFTADCWAEFNAQPAQDDEWAFPSISLDIWFDVDVHNLHRVKNLIPSLDWENAPVGIRLEYGVKDAATTVQNYRELRERVARTVEEAKGNGESAYKPWPQNMTTYLEKRLKQEYEVRYRILDYSQAVDFEFDADYVPASFATATTGGLATINSLLKIDFMDAQRHLSDADTRGRSEDLSRKLSRFYKRNLDQYEADLTALQALAGSEAQLTEHFGQVFKKTLQDIRTLGYPGFANPEISVKAAMRPETLLTDNAGVHYVLPGIAPDDDGWFLTLPDQYNGLGFKNLIYMALEVLDFHRAWVETKEDRPPVHLVMIEEPEAHLHAQLQQVFINKILSVLPPPTHGQSQLVVTTHSAHIIYESSFTPVRYFRREDRKDGVHLTEVRNLSTFYAGQGDESKRFLYQYFKLTHCDLFFADAAVLVEGNVERLLVPLMIEKAARGLKSSHLTILEVGGAFAHKFRELLAFLDLTALVITDLDSVAFASAKDEKIAPAVEDQARAASEPAEQIPTRRRGRVACIASEQGAVTANPTLKTWMPRKSSIADLLVVEESDLLDIEAPHVRVAYQTSQPAKWNGESEKLAGRTIEEAFALENLEWTQAEAQSDLGLRVVGDGEQGVSLADVHRRLFEAVHNDLDKTQFALALMVTDPETWAVPTYIAEGLAWLENQLKAEEPGELPVSDKELS